MVRWYSACLASARSGVQTPVPFIKRKKKDFKNSRLRNTQLCDSRKPQCHGHCKVQDKQLGYQISLANPMSPSCEHRIASLLLSNCHYFSSSWGKTVTSLLTELPASVIHILPQNFEENFLPKIISCKSFEARPCGESWQPSEAFCMKGNLQSALGRESPEAGCAQVQGQGVSTP
jgi:hypothetical protein